jgi:prevent-host-death family protein
MASEIAVTQAREDLADLVNRVAYGSERIVLTRHGKPVAALVSREDLALLERHDRAGEDTAQHRVRLSQTGAGPSAGSPAGPEPARTAEPLRIAAEHPQGHPGAPPPLP